MEDRDRPAVRGLRPEREDERQHAAAIQALHVVRAHLQNVRNSAERANQAADEAARAVEALSARRGATHYARAIQKAEKIHVEAWTLQEVAFSRSLDVAQRATALLDVLRELESARWS